MSDILLAARNGDLTAVILHISQGVSINTTNSYGQTLLHLTATQGHLKLVEYLLANGVNTNATDTFGQTPLHLATFSGHLEMVKYLVGKGADTDLTDTSGRMPLYLAAQWSKLDVVKYLVSCHINRILQSPSSVLSKLNEAALQHDSVKQAFKAHGCWDESKNAISVPKVASTENSQDKPFRSSNLLPLNRSSKKSSSKLQPSMKITSSSLL